MVKKIRQRLNSYVPSNFHDFFGLTYRLIVSGKAAGRMAMVYSFFGLFLTPLDLMLQPFEKRLYKKAGKPEKPMMLVCGPPRSGTTLVAQVLIKYLPVQYFNNLTSLFPRSPIMAQRLFGWMARTDKSKLNYNSFYGRTGKLSQANDALYFWDRWNGPDRKKVPLSYSDGTVEAMNNFFGAVQNETGGILLNKNNAINTFGGLVADALPNARFVCLQRDPVFLAQSHVTARKFIHGSLDVPYGVRGGDTDESPAVDGIEDICRQVQFHMNCEQEMMEKIPGDRIVFVSYDDFCKRPVHWVNTISEKFLGSKPDQDVLNKELKPFTSSNKQRLSDEDFQRIQGYLADGAPVLKPETSS